GVPDQGLHVTGVSARVQAAAADELTHLSLEQCYAVGHPVPQWLQSAPSAPVRRVRSRVAESRGARGAIVEKFPWRGGCRGARRATATVRKPALPIEESGVLEERAALRYRLQ